jgi:hypothetical protein
MPKDWPSREDIHEVEFVLEIGVILDCMNSGRQWFFSDHQKYEELYEYYKDHFF